jgi:hypothetical protein
LSSNKKKCCKAKKSSKNKRFIKINRSDISCEILAFYTLIAFVIILYYFNAIPFLYNVCSVSICLLMRWKMTQIGETGETKNYRLNSTALKKIWALNWKNTFLSSIYFCLNPRKINERLFFSTSDISFITF